MKGEKAYIVIYSFMIEDLKLDPSSVLVFAYIYGFCLKYGVCDSSLAFISKKTGLSKRNVQRVLAELVEKNILYKVERDTKKGNIPNTYGVKGIDKLSTHRKGIDKMTIPNAEGIDKIAPEYRQDVHRGIDKLSTQEIKLEISKNKKEIEIKNKDKENNFISNDDSNEPSWEEIINELRM